MHVSTIARRTIAVGTIQAGPVGKTQDDRWASRFMAVTVVSGDEYGEKRTMATRPSDAVMVPAAQERDENPCRLSRCESTPKAHFRGARGDHERPIEPEHSRGGVWPRDGAGRVVATGC